jgi:hypothetical protein
VLPTAVSYEVRAVFLDCFQVIITGLSLWLLAVILAFHGLIIVF